MIVSILGMPGAGKTSLAKKLATRFNMTHVSAGDVARQMAETDPEVKAALDAGKLAPRGKMNVAMDKIVQSSDHHRVVLDGYPRYPRQLAPLLRKTDTIYIIVGCTQAESMERLLKRGRSDDQLKQIDSRLGTFWDETEPMFDGLLENERTRYLQTGLTQDAAFHEAEAHLIRHGIRPHIVE
jgi:adenylate kinase family enzyme